MLCEYCEISKVHVMFSSNDDFISKNRQKYYFCHLFRQSLSLQSASLPSQFVLSFLCTL